MLEKTHVFLAIDEFQLAIPLKDIIFELSFIIELMGGHFSIQFDIISVLTNELKV